VIAVSSPYSLVNSRLLEILACPKDKGNLFYIADEDMLYNPRLQMRYEVRQGIPVMLIDEATTVNQVEHERIMAKVTQLKLTPTFQ
jgi:uncharacterized protein YbaR (Trm112 family)